MLRLRIGGCRIYFADWSIVGSRLGVEGRLFGQATGPIDFSKSFIASKYERFHESVNEAYAIYFSLSPDERDVLRQIDFPTTGKITQSVLRESIVSQITNANLLSSKVKGKLIDKLGLNVGDAEEAVENFRSHYEYLFWTDHSEVHMQDVLRKSNDNAVNWPPGFVKPFEKVILDPIGNRHPMGHSLARFQYVHESESSCRNADFEYDGSLPTTFSSFEKTMIGVLSMLHSKTLIPYSQLAEWPEILDNKILPNLKERGMITDARSADIRSWIRQLNAEDRQNLVTAQPGFASAMWTVRSGPH